MKNYSLIFMLSLSMAVSNTFCQSNIKWWIDIVERHNIDTITYHEFSNLVVFSDSITETSANISFYHPTYIQNRLNDYTIFTFNTMKYDKEKMILTGDIGTSVTFSTIDNNVRPIFLGGLSDFYYNMNTYMMMSSNDRYNWKDPNYKPPRKYNIMTSKSK
jgi:hypothetical protein